MLGATGFLASCGTVLGLFSASSWPAELASHFRLQYFAVLAALAVAFLAARRRRSALVFAAFALTNFAAILPLYRADTVRVAASVTRFRVMLSNVYADNERFDLVLEAVERYAPDVLVVEEVRPAWAKRLAALASVYPHSVVEARDDNFGIALYSRHALTEPTVLYLGDVGIPSIAVEVEIGPTPLYVVATHPVPPAGGWYSSARNDQLEKIGRYMRNAPRPAILVGDLNVTPWSSYFSRLLLDADLQDSMKGYGPQLTWPVELWPARIPIDHCLYSSGVRVINRQVGSFVGSDHYPLIVDLEVGGPAGTMKASYER